MEEGKLEKLEGDPKKADSYKRGNTVVLDRECAGIWEIEQAKESKAETAFVHK